MSREIPLTRGLVAIVDDEDFDWLSQWKWRALRASCKEEKWYAYRTSWIVGAGAGPGVYMHREIAQPDRGLVVDHIDYDGLNNQRSNLRITTTALNVRAMRKAPGVSGFRGVRPSRSGKRWYATLNLTRDGSNPQPKVHLGAFDDAESAARAYDAAAFAHFGEFAVLNFSGPGLR